MDKYIRDFKTKITKSRIVGNATECSTILKNSVSNDFKIFHMNIRSINKNFDEFKILVEQLESKFDMYVLSETWQIHDPTLFNIDGYTLIYNSGDFNQNDGVVVFIRNSIKFKSNIVNIGHFKSIEISCKINNKTYLVTALYRPPSNTKREIQDFNNNLKNYLKSLKNYLDFHLVVGDINIDITDNRDVINDYLNLLGEEGFTPAINSFTRVDGNSKTCIDHIFIKNKMQNNNTYNYIPIILQSHITDHYPVIVQIITPGKSVPIDKKEKYKIFLDKNKLQEKLREEQWVDVYSSSNVHEATEMFINKLKLNIQECTKTVKLKNKYQRRKSWVTNGLINAINKKDELYKIMKKYPTIENTNKYKNYRNKLNELIKKTKFNYYQKIINENKNSSSSLWNTIKEITHESKAEHEIQKIKTQDGMVITDEKEISNSFCNYFTEVGKNLADKIKTNNSDFPCNVSHMSNSIFLAETNKDEIIKTIQLLKNKKAPGIDNLKTETLKSIANEIALPLTYLINRSFQTGECPTAFKIAILKPLFKKGDKLDMANYRPISLISNVAKIFEKILKNRIESYLEKYNILSDKQLGFRENRSTQDAIAGLTSKISKCIDSKKPALCVFVDLAKAFDTVSHTQLLKVLDNIGFRGTPYQLMYSYLSNRIQCAKINGTISEVKVVEYGVPQGTVLGPLLFNIYLNDLFSLKVKGEIISFADDTAIFYSEKDWTLLKKTVETDLATIFSWFSNKLLTINYSKTCYLTFTSYNRFLPAYKKLSIKLNTNEVEIASVQNIKYLGVFIDCNLKWDVHINYVVKKLRTLLYKFRHLSQLLQIEQLKTLYHALIESHINYGIVAWGAATNNHIKNLQTIQKLILKIVYKKHWTYPTDNLFAETKLFDIRQLYCQTLLIRQHNNKNELKSIEHDHNTRYKTNATVVPKTEKTIAQRCFTYLGPKIYNILPPVIKKINSRNMFKDELKKWIRTIPRLEIHKIVDIKNIYYTS